MTYLGKSEIAQILEAAQHKTRDHLMILFGAMHGMRKSEIAALKVSDVVGGQIRIRRVKGSLATSHPLMTSPDPLFDETRALSGWLAKRPQDDSGALFPSRKGGFMTPKQAGRVITSYMLSAGIQKSLAHSHSLKHFTCSYLCRQGMGVEFVKTFVGHKDVKNTIVYLNISDAEASEKAKLAFQ